MRNDATSLRAAIERVFEQRDVDIAEIVIAVGPSEDETAEVAADLAADYSTVSVIDNPTGRTPAGLNAAINTSTSPVIVRVDARSILPVDYIANALETLMETQAGNVGAIQRPVGSTLRQRSIAAAMRSWLGSGAPAYRGSAERQQVDTAYLGVFRRSALEDVGGYDEGFIRNQDAELNIRLNKAGHSVWLDPRLVVDYYPRRTITTLARQYWQYGWWRQRTIRAHQSSVQLRQIPAPLLVVAVTLSLIAAIVLTPWFLIIPLGYLGAMLGGALVTGEGSLFERLLTAAAFVTMHLSWGAGFLASVLDRRSS